MTRETVFITPGQLDLSCLTTFGVSVKKNDNPIGRFGTGLKYALAVLMREGAEVFIATGGITYEVGQSAVTIRDKTFQQINLRNTGTTYAKQYTELPFTSELGKDWELWQSFREIYSNTLDENGKINTSPAPVFVAAGNTYITVIHDEFAEIAENREDYFKEDRSKAIQAGPLGHIYPNDESRGLFYKGIRKQQNFLPAVNGYGGR